MQSCGVTRGLGEFDNWRVESGCVLLGGAILTVAEDCLDENSGCHNREMGTCDCALPCECVHALTNGRLW